MKISEAQPGIEASFEGTGVNCTSRGSEEGNVQFGAGLGGSVKVYKELEVYLNGNYYGADNYSNIYGNAGVRYSFCGK